MNGNHGPPTSGSPRRRSCRDLGRRRGAVSQRVLKKKKRTAGTSRWGSGHHCCTTGREPALAREITTRCNWHGPRPGMAVVARRDGTTQATEQLLRSEERDRSLVETTQE